MSKHAIILLNGPIGSGKTWLSKALESRYDKHPTNLVLSYRTGPFALADLILAYHVNLASRYNYDSFKKATFEIVRDSESVTITGRQWLIDFIETIRVNDAGYPANRLVRHMVKEAENRKHDYKTISVFDCIGSPEECAAAATIVRALKDTVILGVNLTGNIIYPHSIHFIGEDGISESRKYTNFLEVSDADGVPLLETPRNRITDIANIGDSPTHWSSLAFDRLTQRLDQLDF